MIKVERSKQGRRSDLEGVMAVVTNSVDPTQSPSHIQRVFSAVKRRTGLSISELTHEMQRIRSQVENLINDSLYIDASEKIVTHYRHVKRVFSTISDEIGCEAIDVDRIGTWKFDLFTTNWDLSVDILARTLHLSIDDGFNLDSNRDLCFAGERQEQGACLRLFKLHGSIDQFTLETGKVIKVPISPKDMDYGESYGKGSNVPKTLYGDRIRHRAMIYPTTMKWRYLSDEPFKSAYSELAATLTREPIVLMIGYSLKDPKIVNIFQRAKKRNKHLKIVVVSKSLPNLHGIPMTKKYETPIEKM
jgi:hypothetical protein